MKGIVLAGGSGTRLFPVTKALSKHLLPLGGKPLIYYALSVLMLADIKEIILICNKDDLANYQKLLGDGSKLGISIDYVIQPQPRGIAQAFLLTEEQIVDSNVALILGDNLFYGHGFSDQLQKAASQSTGATCFGYRVGNPECFGVLGFDESGRVNSVEEKPARPKSNYAVTGLYFYDSQVVSFAKELSPSARGELEITDINRRYLEAGQLRVEPLGRGFAWLDTGTHKSLMDAGIFINAIEARQGVKVACLEELAYRKGWITADSLKESARELRHSDYGAYLHQLISEITQS